MQFQKIDALLIYVNHQTFSIFLRYKGYNGIHGITFIYTVFWKSSFT